MKKILLGLVGLAGAGKSTAVEIIQSEINVQSVYFGGIVLAEVERRGLPAEQQYEKQVREELREKNGMSAIAQLAVPSILEAFKENHIVLVDGIYSWEEVDYLRGVGEFELKLIAIHADRQVREERVAKRKVRPLDASGLWQRDINEVKALDKATPVALADYHAINNSGKSELREQLLQILKKVHI